MLSIVVAIRVLKVLIISECSAIFVLRLFRDWSGQERSKAGVDAGGPMKICRRRARIAVDSALGAKFKPQDPRQKAGQKHSYHAAGELTADVAGHRRLQPVGRVKRDGWRGALRDNRKHQPPIG